jgi:hypothetical protein
MAEITIASPQNVRPLDNFNPVRGNMVEATQFGRAVHNKGANSTWKQARANIAANADGLIGIVVSNNYHRQAANGHIVQANAEVDIVTFGRVTGFTGLTPGDPVYLSALDSGFLTTTKPAVARQVGWVYNATTIFIVQSGDSEST